MKQLIKIFAVVAALSPVFGASSANADRIYNFPRVNGAILDHCWSWATNCGWARAHWYCQRRGHPRARSFSRYRPGRTYVVGSRRYCTGGNCVGYRAIRCVAQGGGGGGVGNKASFCRNYARRALSHQRANRARRCGGFGARWHSNYANHYNWCMRVAPARARSEDNARQARLRRCSAAGGGAGNKVAFCRNYAQRAVSHQRTNRARRCGGWGPRWHSNYANHYNWCMGVAPGRARTEDNARLVRLRRCGAAGGGAVCNDRRPVCGWWRGRQYNFANICQLRRRGARFVRYGRCGGGGGGAGSCFVRNARITVSIPGSCSARSMRIPFPFSRMRNGQSYRVTVNSGTIGTGYGPWGRCNFHTNIVYRCRNGRLRIQQVQECRQARSNVRGAQCSVTN